MSSRKLSRPHIPHPGPALSALTLALTFFLALPPQFVVLAGDILRGGAPGTASRGGTVQGQTTAAVQAGAPSGKDILSQTAQALNAVKNMQAAARAAALSGPNNLGADPNHPGMQLPNVPNGLGPGGLQVAPGVGTNPDLWVGASLPTQTVSGTKTNVTIVQDQQQALLNWQTFNIGKDTKLLFDQTAGGANASQWIAFNKVNDPSGIPSQILGSIDALGQIYIINANGIIFGGSSQINLHTLVASALPINDNLIARGLLNNPDNQFLFSALALPAGVNGTPAFTPDPSNTPDGQYGDVTVQAGAQITSPTSADQVGGRVALIGANVDNQGTISTPDGQTILAAGLQVGLAAHSSNDPSLRGLDVYIGQVGDYAGRATNSGLIDALRANVTIAGKNVDQLGFINSSTSVALNGRIDLLANYNAISTDPRTTDPEAAPFLNQASGVVTLAPESVIQILPELASTDRVVGTQLALGSQINIQGLAIHQGTNAIVLAPSANVSFNAGTWVTYIASSFLTSEFIAAGGQIYLDAGAIIDVAGSSDVQASVTENIVAAQLLGPELANFPLQRDGALRGQTVYIDITKTGTYNGQTWIGTPLADVSGYANLVQRTAGELTIAGGNVNLSAGESVVLQNGSLIDVSGGWINYAGANVNTTQVVSGGRVFDISQATPDRVYDGILGGFTTVHTKWGVVDSFGTPLGTTGRFEPGYVQGGNGGTLTITAPSMALDGTLLGNTVAGDRQLVTPPIASTLALNFQALTPQSPDFLPISPTPPNIVFGTGTLAAADPFAVDANGNPVALRADRKEEVILSPDLVNVNGFGNFKIDNSDGNISVPADVDLTLAVGGSLSLSGANIDIAGNITAPGGNLTFNVYQVSPFLFATLIPGSPTPGVDPNRGRFTLAAGASLNAAGLITDFRPTASPVSMPYTAAGGTITINSYDTFLAAGSFIDVSGGVTVSANGQISYGNGGAISIKAGQDLNVKWLLGGELNLGSELIGYSGSKGGSLSILAPMIQIGGSTNDPDTLLLSPEFFNQGGFSNFALTGLGAATGQVDVFSPAIVIAPGTTIMPVAQSYVANLGSLTSPRLSLDLVTLPQGVRAPVSLSFNAPGVRDNLNGGDLPVVRGDFVMGEGSLIQTDPLGNVSISAHTAAVLGSIITPGGNITISGGTNSARLFSDATRALVTVDLGPNSFLSAAGTTLLTPDPRGFRTGRVLDGGRITISGNIVAESGAVLDVSGASDTLDFAPGYVNGSSAGSFSGATMVPVRVDSNGGAIILAGGQELFTDATLLGSAGGPNGIGGTLTISSDRFRLLGTATPLDITLVVTQSGPQIPGAFYPAGSNAIGRAVFSGDQNTAGHFSADSFNNSGLASINLLGTVQFSGPVTINADLSIAVASNGVLFGDAAINLNAPYVHLGSAFAPPAQPDAQPNSFFVGGNIFPVAPQFGAGTLSVSASLIDIGNLSLQGIGTADLVANDGDIRGDGTFDIAGNVSLTAGQIYPPSATQFTIAAYDYVNNGNAQAGSITVIGSGIRPLPLSAGGELNLYASIINQGGTLRAPIGTINLGWDGNGVAPIDLLTRAPLPIAQQITLQPGSVTSVSAIDPITGEAVTIPYGFNLNGTAWIDPAGNDITFGGVPMKSVNISGLNVADLPGSTIDIRGGGDLYAYQFQSGTGGLIDILNSSSSFAIIPDYALGYAPFAPYNSNASGNPFGSDIGYTNANLVVGDQIFLNAGSGLPAGTYTLLPARYALLPGAFLITPKSVAPNGTQLQPDGSSIVSGYRLNGFAPPAGEPLLSAFEVASLSVVRNRAEYLDYFANTYLRQAALDQGLPAPRLPIDSGRLLFQATQTMSILGSLSAQAPNGGRGGLVDISSPIDILIAGPGATGAPGQLVLDAAALSAFGAESLLIGGVRESGPDGTTVEVATNNIIVDNSGSPLSAPDLILVANISLTLAPGAVITQTGTLATSADFLLLGDSSNFGSGDGVLLRVSADPLAQIARFGVNPSNLAPQEIIGAGAQITGTSITLDSTAGTSLDPTAVLSGSAINLNSGQISIQLANGGSPANTTGLVLAGVALQNLQSVQSLSLLSYSSIDIYGTGMISAANALALHAAEIRGFNNGGIVDFSAKTIVLDNSANAMAPGAIAAQNGSIQFTAETVQFGANALQIDQFEAATFNALRGILLAGSGSFMLQGDLTINAPVITATQRATQSIGATGQVVLQSSSAPAGDPLVSSLGSSLTISGASILANTDILLPSGQLTLHATTGDLVVGNMGPANLDVSGTAQTFFDLVKYTNGGEIRLLADNGDVDLASGAVVNVSAQPEGGNAGLLEVSAPQGVFIVNGTLLGQGGENGRGGSFVLDVGSLPTLSGLSALLNAASFTQLNSIRVRTGDVLVDGLAIARTFNLSTDAGSIDVTGTIDASGITGGTINLRASGSVVLENGALLTVAADEFDNAGKGGAVSLEAGSQTNGVIDTNAVLDIQTGSTIDLSVAAAPELGDFSGTLHLRAPQLASQTDLQMNPINGNIIGASKIVVEGYRLFDLTATGGAINTSVQAAVNQNALTFIGPNGTTTATYAAMLNRLFANNQSLESIAVIEAGAEIINRNGNLTLGSVNSTASSDWNLATARYGPLGAPGVLTLRAAGNLVFYNALSDGFTSSAFDAVLLNQNPLLPINEQSWSFRLVAGSDFGAADYHFVQSLDLLGPNSGSVLLGKNYSNVFPPTGANASTRNAVQNRFQVIRTGSGDIDIVAGRDVKLLNQFATIYTAGTRVTDPTLGGTFDLPITNAAGQQSGLGSIQQPNPYPAQYSMAGGNVTITAQQDIVHQTLVGGVLTDDSSRELPINWLYRRGFVDPVTGLFGAVTRSGANDIGSTTWWIDFSNFFEGVGALGGGNVTLIAGNDIRNVDAVAPTNARMAGKDSNGNPIAPDLANLVELGGGDVTVIAGGNIDGGVYYVERGQGVLQAGDEIKTNATRSPSLTSLVSPANILAEQTWLPTTLFLGKGSFDVSANSDVLLGPVANPFLLPAGINNTFWYKTYFSTFGANDSVNVASLNGDITLRESATPPGENAASPLLLMWLSNIARLASNPPSASFFQPWLRLSETDMTPFETFAALLPPALRVTAFAGDVNLVGNLTLFPSPVGTIDLLARGAINAVQPNGLSTLGGRMVTTWGASVINLSDADPAQIPGVTSPFAYRATITNPTNAGRNQAVNPAFLNSINATFAETGSIQGEASVLQNKQRLHAAGLLHAADPNPVRLYAGAGDISGLTLFAGKPAMVIAGRDITDIALYVQNNSAADLTLIAAGRDLVAYDPTSALRVMAQTGNNSINLDSAPAAGDIQISGPGTLEVFAGRNLDLGVGPNNPDGTALGITSIGNARNPFLPFEGADIIVGAGIGVASSLADSNLDFAAFESQFLDPSTAGANASRYLPELGQLLGLAENTSNAGIWDAFNQLSEEEQAIRALDIFYLVLRDAGRDRNDPASPNFGNFDNGFAAIAALFPGDEWRGDISLTSREIKTKNGGNISIFAPGGQLSVGLNVTGTQPLDQGILTEHGGNISIFTRDSVNVGTSRIFTLRGGNEIIWSSEGDIAAGASSKTVQSAPPTRVLIDPQSGDVQTDLAGLATGGGIGVLETVAGVPPSDVDLIAPVGVIDAGDAGIRVSGNLNLAAVQVINAGNIQVGGTSAGVPTIAAPNIGGLTSAANTVAASSNAAQQLAGQNAGPAQEEVPSIISVEVLGYGGSEDEEERRRKKKQQLENQGSIREPAQRVTKSRRSDTDAGLSLAFNSDHK